MTGWGASVPLLVALAAGGAVGCGGAARLSDDGGTGAGGHAQLGDDGGSGQLDGLDAGPVPVVLTGAAAEALVACIAPEGDGGGADGGPPAGTDGGVTGADGSVDPDGGVAGADGSADADGGQTGAAGAWSHSFGDLSYDQAIDVAAGGDGTALLLSSQIGMVDFGAGPVGAAPGALSYCSDYLSAFGPTGANRWSRTLAEPQKIVAGPDGGSFVMLRTGTLARLGPDGSVLWAREVDGMQAGTVQFRAGALFSATTGNYPYSIIVERLTLDGDRVWAYALPAVLTYVFAVSPAAELVFGLWLQSTATIGTETFTTAGGAGNIIIGKVGANGVLAWVRQYATPSERLIDLTVSADGSIVFLGEGTEATDLGAGPIGAVAGSDAGSTYVPGGIGFLARLDASGKVVETRALTSPQIGRWVRELPSGALVVGDDFQGPIDVAGMTVHTGAVGDVDFLVLETSPTFDVQQILHFGNGGGAQHLGALAVDPTGSLLVAGQFQGKLDLGSGLLKSAGSYDVFIGKVTP
jgi:hypothetical protein